MTQPGTLEAATEHLFSALSALRDPVLPSPLPVSVSVGHLTETLRSAVVSRALDVSARRLKPSGRIFYTIGSAGHECNALVAQHLRLSDPALLHYRSGAFSARRYLIDGIDPASVMFKSFLLSADDPVSGGRHKVIGGPGIIPQTSTIASHAPRALGMALAIPRSDKLSLPQDKFPSDSVVLCSFGDASFNHSTLQGSLNAAAISSFQGIPVPLIFLCEDNSIGISTRSPSGYIKSQMSHREGIDYLSLDPDNILGWHDLLDKAVSRVRSQRKPLFIHMPTVRLGGHAGTDVESAYRSTDEIKRDYLHDPILIYASNLVESGAMSAADVLGFVTQVMEDTYLLCDSMVASDDNHVISSLAQVSQPLFSENPGSLTRHSVSLAEFQKVSLKPLTLAQSINHTLGTTLEALPNATLFGQDVGAKGGVYGVTKGLQRRFGRSRVFDSILDEQSILGYALGSALLGALPIPEIQYLAYLHNAEDQLRGEAASLSFFSNSQFRNGTVVRVASYGYQRGFGGHFHNDNSVSVLRDIPGLVIASPSRPSDAAQILSSCVSHAAHDGRVCVFLEPIALYHTTDLFEPGDGLFQEPIPDLSSLPRLGTPRFYPAPDGSSGDLVLASWANGLYMSLRAQRSLLKSGVRASVVDMRFLAPLPVEPLADFARSTPVLVVDETRFSGGVGESIVSSLAQMGHRSVSRVSSLDSFIPTGPAADLVLLQEAGVISAAGKILGI